MNIRVGNKPTVPSPVENQAAKPLSAPENQAAKPNSPQSNPGSSYPPGFIMPPPERRTTWRDVYHAINPLPWILLILLILRIFK